MARNVSVIDESDIFCKHFALTYLKNELNKLEKSVEVCKEDAILHASNATSYLHIAKKYITSDEFERYNALINRRIREFKNNCVCKCKG